MRKNVAQTIVVRLHHITWQLPLFWLTTLINKKRCDSQETNHRIRRFHYSRLKEEGKKTCCSSWGPDFLTRRLSNTLTLSIRPIHRAAFEYSSHSCHRRDCWHGHSFDVYGLHARIHSDAFHSSFSDFLHSPAIAHHSIIDSLRSRYFFPAQHRWRWVYISQRTEYLISCLLFTIFTRQSLSTRLSSTGVCVRSVGVFIYLLTISILNRILRVYSASSIKALFLPLGCIYLYLIRRDGSRASLLYLVIESFRWAWQRPNRRVQLALEFRHHHHKNTMDKVDDRVKIIRRFYIEEYLVVWKLDIA